MRASLLLGLVACRSAEIVSDSGADTVPDTDADADTDADTDTDTDADTDTGVVVAAPVVVNEVVTDNKSVRDDLGGYADWLELYNPTDETVYLGGYGVSDDWTEPMKHVLDASVSIPAGGYLVLWATGTADGGPLHLPFRLSSSGESVGLFDPDGAAVDWAVIPPLLDDTAYARIPDGGPDWQVLAIGTPGAPNEVLVLETALVARSGEAWRYWDGDSIPAGWAEVGFDDSGWSSGASPLGYGDSLSTTIGYGASSSSKHPAAWFRRTVSVEDVSRVRSVRLELRCDDGAVVYLNGAEVHRRNMPSGTITEDTLASVTVSGTDETAFFEVALDVGVLVSGENTLAVEVHQADLASSDLGFDLQLALEIATSAR